MTRKFQSDPIESRFGWYKHFSGGNYFVSARHIFETQIEDFHFVRFKMYSNWNLWVTFWKRDPLLQMWRKCRRSLQRINWFSSLPQYGCDWHECNCPRSTSHVQGALGARMRTLEQKQVWKDQTCIEILRLFIEDTADFLHRLVTHNEIISSCGHHFDPETKAESRPGKQWLPSTKKIQVSWKEHGFFGIPLLIT